MKSLQEIRIDIVRMGKEIRVNPSFEEQFQKLCKYLETEFGASEFKLEDYEMDRIDNNRFESEILKCAVCHAFKINYSPGNPWFNVFQVLKSEDSTGYHGSVSDKLLSYSSRGMTKHRNDIEDISSSADIIFRLLSYSYNGMPARISDFWTILFKTFNIKDPKDYIDYWDQKTIFFDSYLIDVYSKWLRNEEVDFSELQEKVLSNIESSSARIEFTNPGDFQDRLWAIFLFLSDPNLNYKTNF